MLYLTKHPKELKHQKKKVKIRINFNMAQNAGGYDYDMFVDKAQAANFLCSMYDNVFNILFFFIFRMHLTVADM